MDILNGKSVCGGIAFGTVRYYKKQQRNIRQSREGGAEQELLRLGKAKDTVLKELDTLYQKALKEAGEEDAEIFQIHAMMLEDEDFSGAITSMLREQEVSAEYAVNAVGADFAASFDRMEDEYMRGRAADIRDITGRLLDALTGGEKGGITLETPAILAADDLAPSETVQLDKSKILAFLTRHGSATSHTAILARTMNIPAIIGLGESIGPEHDGKQAIVDGFAGKVYLDPDEATIQRMKQRLEQERAKDEFSSRLRGQETITRDGRKIRLYANIGSPSDLGKVLDGDAEGIGLFRSEFLFLQKSDYPTEQEQFLAYKSVLEAMGQKQVIVRTLDIGADKQADYFNLPQEANPALGCRAIRLCLTRPELFQTQLRALLRASVYGKLSIMFPMIASLWEIRKVKEIVEEVRAELTKQKIAFASDIPLGIMVETPAAAIMSDALAREVDFFSIGTNDLTQYTLAVDRENQNLGEFCDPHHPAVLRLIRQTVESAHQNGIWAGICGELGADPALTETFLAMGVDELSVSPAAVLGLRGIIRGTDVSKIREPELKFAD